MAIKIPVAGINLNWGTGSNWSGGTIPANGDIVLFEPGKVYRYSAGLDQNAVNLAGMFLPSSSELYIDGGGTLTIDISTAPGQLSLLGRGIVRISGDVDSVYIANPGMAFVGSGGAFPVVNVAGGRVECLETCDLTRVFASGGAQVKILASGGSDRVDSAVVRDRNASIESLRAIDTATVSAGRLKLSGAGTITASTGVANVVGGSLEFASTATTAGTINALAGAVTFQEQAANITVDAVFVDPRSCRLSEASPAATITFTAKTSVTPEYLGATMVPGIETNTGT